MPDDQGLQRELGKLSTGASRDSASSAASSVWRRSRFWLLASIGALVAIELLARFGVGLGDPPLTIRDPKIDYLFAPSRCYRRFHRLSCYNQWSMRAAEFPRNKQGCVARVLVLGDSIVHGGVMLDQSELATELLREKLDRSGHKSTVGNISAGSWGPANILAYTARFGWFDADVAVFVFNSGDVADIPDFLPDLGIDYPTETPLSAVSELLTRYGPRYLPSIFGVQPAATASPEPPEKNRAAGIEALGQLLREAKAHVAQVVVLLHFEAAELATGIADEGLFRTISEQAGARFISLGPSENPSLYRDHIHLNEAGQAVLGRVLFDVVGPILPVCQP